MGESWPRNIATSILVVLTASNLLLSQSKWNSSDCGRIAPTLDRIMINSCKSYDLDEYLLFHTNKRSFNLNSSRLSVQVNVTNGPYSSNFWGSNAAALKNLNKKSGCKDVLFLDPFEHPYNGVIPEQANVIAFVQRNPDFSGTLSGLCDQKAIFVIFGNYSGGFIKSMFANSCTGCTRNVVVSLGSCKYNITYEPNRLDYKNGAYISGRRSSVGYGVASGCKPSFYDFQSTPDPKMKRIELSKCANDNEITQKFSVINGNKQTTWYTNLDKEPIAWGPTFRPKASLFPLAFGSKPSSRSIFVRNNYGGRPGKPLELTLTTYPAPLSYSVGLFCPSDSICTSCKGEPIRIGIDIKHSAGLGGFPYRNMSISAGQDSFSVTGLRPGENIFDLQTSDTSTMNFKIISVVNKYGCISTSGFAPEQLTVRLKDSILDYLPDIPDMCSSDPIYPLPVSPGGLSGEWRLSGKTVTQIDPASLETKSYKAYYIPDKPCAAIDSAGFTIYKVSNPEITLPLFDCNNKTYRPLLTNHMSAEGYWTIDPVIPVDSVNGEISVAELESGTTYTWTFSSSQSCSVNVEDSLTVPNCQCKLQGAIENVTCHDNNTPADSTDDTFTFELSVSGQNHTTGWQTEDGNLKGIYDSTYLMGPYPIADGSRNIIIADQLDATCRTITSVDPPESCSPSCEITVRLSDIICYDNNTSADSTDDTFTFELSVSGQNHTTGWQTEDDSLKGIYDSTYLVGPYPIADGSRNITISDQLDATCQTTASIDPPESCSPSCEITAHLSDIICHDNHTPVDSTDDTFTFELSVSGQNHTTGWQTEDGSLKGIYDSTYIVGPFPIADGSRNITIADQLDATCQTTASIDPPEACSRFCEITAHLSDIICNDNNTPADSTDDTFTFELSVSGQNHTTGWQTEDDSLKGKYDSTYIMGPYPIADGSRNITIADQLDATCQTSILIDPPETCSNSTTCQMEVSVRDSCLLDAANHQQIYYFIDVKIPESNPQFWVFHQKTLKDIIPGRGTIPIGPFNTSHIGDKLHISYDKNPNCVEDIQLFAPSSCKDTNSAICELKFSDLNVQDCHIDMNEEFAEVNLNVSILSSSYPVQLSVNNHSIANVPDDGLHTYSFSTFSPQSGQDSLLINLQQSDQCTKSSRIPYFCQKKSFYFPNAFTPNQDGQNDQWIARIPPEAEILSAAIYDRWGNRIFTNAKSSNPNGTIIWDGEIGGQSAEPGTYLYRIAWRKEGITKNKSGQIILLR